MVVLKLQLFTLDAELWQLAWIAVLVEVLS